MSVTWGIREPEKVLDEVSFQCVARCIREGKFRKIMVMAGAGISTSAGIPDYRSPVTGMYEQLRTKHPQLRCMEDLFSIQFFLKNPVPFFQRSKPFFQISLKPTPCHYFIRLLHEKGILLRHYTQNIDTLERVAGLPEDKVVEAHGSYFTSHCQGCDKQYDFSWLEEKVLKDLVPICDEPDCSAVVKPDIVLFNETLSTDFSLKMEQDTLDCDLLLIMGTALAVQPFASLTGKVKINTPRVYINMDRGNTGKKHPIVELAFGGSFDFDEENNYRDVYKEGKCDDAVYEMADIIGWGEELRALVSREHARIDAQDKVRGKLTSLPISQFFEQVTLCENDPLSAGSGEPSAVTFPVVSPSPGGKRPVASGKRTSATGKNAATVGKTDTAAGKALTSGTRSTTSGAAKGSVSPSVRRRSNTSSGKTEPGSNVRRGSSAAGASKVTTADKGSAAVTSVAKDNVYWTGHGTSVSQTSFSSAKHNVSAFGQTAADAGSNFDSKTTTTHADISPGTTHADISSATTHADISSQSAKDSDSEPSNNADSKPVIDADMKPSNHLGREPFTVAGDIPNSAPGKSLIAADSKPPSNSVIKPVANAKSKTTSKPVANVKSSSGKAVASAGKTVARGGNSSASRGKGQSRREEKKAAPGRTSPSSRLPSSAKKH